MDAFNDRWSMLLEDCGDDSDERGLFENLLGEVDTCSDAPTEYDHDGGSEISSAYSIYYAKSAAIAKDAVVRFDNGGTQ